MKKKLLIALVCSGFIVACTKPSSNIAGTNTTQQNVPKTVQETPITEQEALAFGKGLYQKIETDEPLIKKAFKQKNQKLLKQYQDDFLIFNSKPYGAEEAKSPLGQKYYPMNVIAEPYIVCDRALNSLYSVASTMGFIFIQDSPELRASLREKEEYFKKSKAECKTITDMSYKQASTEYEQYI